MDQLAWNLGAETVVLRIPGNLWFLSQSNNTAIHNVLTRVQTSIIHFLKQKYKHKNLYKSIYI